MLDSRAIGALVNDPSQDELQEQNDVLRARVAFLEKELSDANMRPVRVGTWLAAAYITKDVRDTGDALGSRLAKWQSSSGEQFPVQELVAFATAIIVRFVRVGVWRISLALAPMAILLGQLVLLYYQNDKLETQNRLIERQTRAASFGELVRIGEREDEARRLLGIVFDAS